MTFPGERQKEDKVTRKTEGRVPGVVVSPPRGEGSLLSEVGVPVLRAREEGALRPGSGPQALFVRPQEAGDLGAQQLDEGLRQHLLVLLCVLEVVLGVGQDLKEGLDKLLIL